MVADEPVEAQLLAQLLEMSPAKVDELCEELAAAYEADDRGFVLARVAGGWRFQSHPDLAPYVERFVLDGQPSRLSPAALETLAIVAYKQPLTRAEIEEIRGVEVIAALETLLEKRLVKVVGRKETVGRPLMYGTTAEFLRHFGLRSLEDLPPIDSFTPAAAAVPEAAADAFVGQTEEAVMAEALSMHPAGAAEQAAPAEPEPLPETGGEAEDDAYEGPLQTK